MIGVIADPAEHATVREFFELFKTPWEFYHAGRKYDVVLNAGNDQYSGGAKLVLFYAGRNKRFDADETARSCGEQDQGGVLLYQGNRIPIYGDTVTFVDEDSTFLTDESSQQSTVRFKQSADGMTCRIGYDLFGEVRTLLTIGQPAANANTPTLELHIKILRDLITGCGIPLIEVPPVPEGYQCIVCLTHDVDHPSIRQHKWDHTTIGFLYRAVFGSVRNFLRSRIPLRDLVRNWGAALRLPFVQLGFAKDLWSEFGDRYQELENGLPSTFFVIPFKGRPGRKRNGSAPIFRAAKYSARDVADTVRQLQDAGCEVGLHGIDAWLDSSSGREELGEIRRVTGTSGCGVRMHWLYYDQQSPVELERAGAAYDSTTGYNETVGYRAGTTQVFKPLTTDRLLELPLHVMDTALFYPAYLDLSSQQARGLLCQMADDVLRCGGCLTINWHDRSIAPERLWGDCYLNLIDDLKSRGAWFATAGEAVSWFRKRRSVVFDTDSQGIDAVQPESLRMDRWSARLRLRIHKARSSQRNRNSYLRLLC